MYDMPCLPILLSPSWLAAKCTLYLDNVVPARCRRNDRSVPVLLRTRSSSLLLYNVDLCIRVHACECNWQAQLVLFAFFAVTLKKHCAQHCTCRMQSLDFDLEILLPIEFYHSMSLRILSLNAPTNSFKMILDILA